MAVKVKVKKPTRPFRSKPLYDEIRKGLRLINDGVLEDFESTTDTWEHKVVFSKKIKRSTKRLTGMVWTEDEIYGYVNFGTKPHTIVPKSATVLAFPSFYMAKTTPGVIKSQGGGSSGPTVFAAVVEHPGTEAREFDKAISEEWRPKAREIISEAVDAGVRKTNYEIRGA